MGIVRINHVFSAILAFFALILIVQPVCAANEQLTIAYAGSGGSYIGDIIFFSGKDLASNLTLLKISGPGLPPEGVPVYDLNGKPGTGNSVDVNPDGIWRFVWYSASTQGGEKFQTARYTFSVQDVYHPELTASTSVLLKKAEFSLGVTPNPARFGDYVEVVGNAEQATSSVQVDVSDSSGKIYHTFFAPVGADGYFAYGFHADMQPGNYRVNVGNPSMSTTLHKSLTILSPAAATPTPVGSEITPAVPATPAVTTVTPSLPLTGSISVVTDPSNATVMVDSVMMGMTPVTLGGIAAGPHTVVIQAPGYLAYSIQVTVKDNEMVTLTPALVKNPGMSPLPPVVAVMALVIVGGISLLWSAGRKKK